MNKPNIRFFVIGSARSGTTSLYRALEQHPEIYTAPVKEPRFFTQNWNKGWEWYNEIYANAPNNLVLGDFSPSYTNSATRTERRAVNRISKFYPKARIIYMVRNPIASAISNWRMMAEISGEEIPFGEALKNSWAVAVYHRTCFFRQITPYRELLSDEQILAVPLEAMKTDPDTWIAKIHTHIGISQFRTTFPKANASHRKPDRPGAPVITRQERMEFLALVTDDARAMLDYMAMPASLWNLAVNSREWEPE